MKAVYYDPKLGISSFLDDRLFRSTPEGYEIVDYFTVSKWLENAGRGDVLVFAQDIVPDTIYDITPFNSDSKLGEFIKKGGVVVWVGDIPFFYRLRCFPKENEYKGKIERVKEVLKRQVAFTPIPDFYLQRFGPYEKGDKICVLDIIGGFYIDVNEISVSWISLEYKHLGFLRLNEYCYLYSPTPVNQTLIGKMLRYVSHESLRPIKYTTNILPLTLTTLDGVCKGKYAGSWIAQIGEGYFVRLYDVNEEIDPNKVFEIAEKITTYLRV